MSAHEPTRRPLSASALAARLGTSTRTARRVWAQPRAQYEAQSLARQRPWEAQGISRATWYRRKHRAESLAQASAPTVPNRSGPQQGIA